MGRPIRLTRTAALVGVCLGALFALGVLVWCLPAAAHPAATKGSSCSDPYRVLWPRGEGNAMKGDTGYIHVVHKFHFNAPSGNGSSFELSWAPVEKGLKLCKFTFVVVHVCEACEVGHREGTPVMRLVEHSWHPRPFKVYPPGNDWALQRVEATAARNV